MGPLLLLLFACGTDDAGPEPLVDCPRGLFRAEPLPQGGQEQWCEVEGIKHGPYVRTFSDGSQAETGTYAKAQPDGLWIAWHENGQMASRGRFATGKRTGSWTWWHPTGAIERQGDFLGGREQGRFVEHWPSGRLKSEGLYQSGLKTERWIRYEDAEGSPVENVETWVQGEIAEGAALLGDARAFLGGLDGCWPSLELASALRDPERAGRRTGRVGALTCWTPRGGDRWISGRDDIRPDARRAHQRLVVKLSGTGAELIVTQAKDRGEDGRPRDVLAGVDDLPTLPLVEASPERLVFRADAGLWPHTVTLDRAGPLLTVKYEGLENGVERTEGYTWRTDVPLSSIRDRLSLQFRHAERLLRR